MYDQKVSILNNFDKFDLTYSSSEAFKCFCECAYDTTTKGIMDIDTHGTITALWLHFIISLIIYWYKNAA